MANQIINLLKLTYDILDSMNDTEFIKYGGLRNLWLFMVVQCKITNKDFLKLNDYLESNCHTLMRANKSTFYWEQGHKKPRIKWLNKQINRYEK